ncbi:MAG: Holliday junction resolvase RuvX [bacterium]|nr:Holliday junction resolvase RuvX [bacterium]
MNKRILALDIGRKKIGVAVTDPLCITAGPVGYIDASNTKKAIEEIGELIRSYDSDHVVIGFPVNMDGTIGPRAERCREIGNEIAATFGVKVTEYDERLSTREAERLLIDAGMSRAKRKENNDKIAAAIILQNYLASAVI